MDYGRKAAEIQQYAKAIAIKMKYQHTDSINIPTEKPIQYEVIRNIEVEERKWFRTVKRTIQQKELENGKKVAYQKKKINGWIIKIFQIDWNVYEGGFHEKDISKNIYVLKTDGSLVHFHLGYTIDQFKTNHECLNIYSPLNESSVYFSSPYVRSDGTVSVNVGDPHIFDYGDFSWRHSFRSGYKGHKRHVFFQNYPKSEGTLASQGEALPRYEYGDGILEALKSLEKNV